MDILIAFIAYIMLFKIPEYIGLRVELDYIIILIGLLIYFQTDK